MQSRAAGDPRRLFTDFMCIGSELRRLEGQDRLAAVYQEPRIAIAGGSATCPPSAGRVNPNRTEQSLST